jgi:hypothetical protein
MKILEGDSSGSNSRLNPTETLSKTRFLVFLAKFDRELKKGSIGLNIF